MGKLYIVGTPIGNLEDITLRALRVLGEVDLIAAEDTRRTRKLLTHYDIRVRLFSYRRENETRAAVELADRIGEGMNVALVSDAGMPGISDPGFALVAECAGRGLGIEVVPGPSSVTAAIALSGIPVSSFVFEGYLPNKRSARRARLLELGGTDRPVVFFEAPHRIVAALDDVAGLWPSRDLVLVREMTKLHEEVLRGPAAQLLEALQRAEPRGEYVGIITPGAQDERVSPVPLQLAREVQDLLDRGLPRADAFKVTANKWGVPKRTVYDAFLSQGQD